MVRGACEVPPRKVGPVPVAWLSAAVAMLLVAGENLTVHDLVLRPVHLRPVPC